MTERIQIMNGIPGADKALYALSREVTSAALDSGVDHRVVELVKIRASQVNGCAFCLDMHTTDALAQGEDQRRLTMLPAWRETDLYTEQERAALAVTEALTQLSQTNDLPDDVYEYATKVFTETQYQAVVWLATVINAWNRVILPSHPKLPAA